MTVTYSVIIVRDERVQRAVGQVKSSKATSSLQKKTKNENKKNLHKWRCREEGELKTVSF